MFALTLAFVLAPRHAAAAPQAQPARVVLAARQQPLVQVRVEKNVEYGRESGEPLLLDLYTPMEERPGLRPAIVFIHGGGWTGGDKAEFADKAREMAGRGYVAVSVNYRLAPKHRFPAAVLDVERAVRWLKGRAAELRVDPERIASMGASAGGHLAAMLGVRDTWERKTGPVEISARVACVVDYYGRMDLNLEPTGTGMTDFRPTFIGRPKAEAQELWAEASPITYVDAKTVPFLMVHGAVDPQVEPAQSIKMLAALEKANVEATLVLLGNQGHGFRGGSATQAWDTAKAFLDRHLLR